MHRSCPSLVGTTMKLTPKRQCSLLTTITTQTQSCVLQRTLPSPQQTRPCITSPVSCDTEGGGGRAAVSESVLHNHQSTNPCRAPPLRAKICVYTRPYVTRKHTFLRGHRCIETHVATLQENVFQLCLC